MFSSYKYIQETLYDKNSRVASLARYSNEAVTAAQILQNLGIVAAAQATTTTMTSVLSTLPLVAMMQGMLSIVHGVLTCFDAEHLDEISVESEWEEKNYQNNDDFASAEFGPHVHSENAYESVRPPVDKGISAFAQPSAYKIQIGGMTLEPLKKDPLETIEIYEHWAPVRNIARGVLEIISGCYLFYNGYMCNEQSLGLSDLYLKMAIYSSSQLLFAIEDFSSYYWIDKDKRNEEFLNAYWYMRASTVLGAAFTTAGWVLLAATQSVLDQYVNLSFASGAVAYVSTYLLPGLFFKSDRISSPHGDALSKSDTQSEPQQSPRSP